jgi:HD superfamily phosphohydrolase
MDRQLIGLKLRLNAEHAMNSDELTNCTLDSVCEKQIEEIRQAGVSHDIGHYPYFHLKEKVDKEALREKLVGRGIKMTVSVACRSE